MHLKIPNVPTRGRDTVKRKVREEQEKEVVVSHVPSVSVWMKCRLVCGVLLLSYAGRLREDLTNG